MTARIALTMAPQTAPARPRVTNGYTLWSGPSKGTGAPIVVVLTGTARPSENPKTGPMLQLWILPALTAPAEAVKTGEDEAVCNGCPFRAAVRKATGADGPACYVRADGGVNTVWKSWYAGHYPHINRQELARLLMAGNHTVRLGAYGNVSNAPLWVAELLATYARKHTGYDHNWRECDPAYADLVMASVGTPEEREEAKSLGYRTFRVKGPDEPVLPGERECPAQDKFRAAGRHVTCHQCGACHGNRGTPGKADIVIDDHGPTSRITQDKRAAAR